VSSVLAVIADDATSRRSDVRRALSALGCEPVFATLRSAEADVGRIGPDVVVVGGTRPDPGDGLDCLAQLHGSFPYAGYVFLAADSSEDVVIRALHSGAQRYVKEPWTDEAVQGAVKAVLGALASPCAPCPALAGADRLVGRSRAVRELREELARVSPAASNVLVTGETGTGKELVAELIHLNGARSRKPFVCLNTAAMPDTLLESELFGHERGAFTGAVTTEDGKLAAANGGTAFLDEIGDASLSIQAKLLRAIEGKSFHRLGSPRSVQIDVRIVAATNQDLERAVEEGRFRKDLYYRLNVVRVQLPPLRERPEDIPLLVAHYLRHFNRVLGRSVRGLAPAAMDTLGAYHWPGNVRELRNVVEALLVHLAPETTGVVDVPPAVMRQLAFAVGAPTSERERVLQALTATNWNKSKAATQLHWSRMTLYRKMQQHGVGLRR
jgi:DNA-binding NtrC family response regulator